jgi:hypothetical protein
MRDDLLSTAELESRSLRDAQMVVTLHFHSFDSLAACDVLLDGHVRRLRELH